MGYSSNRATEHLPPAPVSPSSVSQGPASSRPGANTTSVLRLGKRTGRVDTVADDYNIMAKFFFSGPVTAKTSVGDRGNTHKKKKHFEN